MTLRSTVRGTASMVLGAPQLWLSLLVLTHRCNLRCVYCGCPHLATDELQTDQWLAIIDQLADLGCRRVFLSGGEALLRPDLARLIARVRDRGMSCGLVSNGVLVEKKIERLHRLSALVLSLDGVGDANDQVRGEGVFAAVTAAVAAARSIGLPVKLNAVLSASTAPGLDQLLDFADGHGLFLTVNLLRSGDPRLWHEAGRLKANDPAIRRTLHRLAHLARTHPRLLYSEQTYRQSARWPDFTRDRLESGDLPPDAPLLRRGPRCQAGRAYLLVNPDGRVSPCAVTIGSILGRSAASDGVAAAWRSLHDHPCVACYAPCWVELNYFFSLKPGVVLNNITRSLRRFH